MTTYRDRVLGLEYHDARDLVPHVGNWRSHGKAQVAALRGVLAEVGIADTILAYRSARNGGKLTVIDGHLRRDAAPQRWPVLVLDVTDEEADYLLVTHDPLAAMANADAAALDALLSSVNSGEAAVQQMLADLASEAGLYGESDKPTGDTEPQVNRADELRQKWGVEPGMMWQLGDHRLICGDCTDAAVVARVMGGDSFDLVVTSPPYNSGDGGYKTDYNGKVKRFYQDDTDDRTEAEWVEFCETVLSVCGQHARDENSVIVWNVMYTARCRSGYGQVLFGGRQPFTVKETICWDKGQGFPTASKGILSRNWELIFILSKGEKYNTTQGDNEPRWAKWDIGRPKAQEETHKATYPIELPSKAMNDFSFADSIVYEPFSGSGTTIIACENLGRRCRAVEISPAYVAVALERWATHTGRTPELVP